MQIHVNVRRDSGPEIKIFSKSKRESTKDRLYTHASVKNYDKDISTEFRIILAALGLPVSAHLPIHPSLAQRSSAGTRSLIKRSVILEAEVVPFNEGNREGNRGRGIEEFWWLGAAGVTVDAVGPK